MTPTDKANLFYVRRIGSLFYVISTYQGIVSEGHDCYGYAQADADERRGDWEAAEVEERAALAD